MVFPASVSTSFVPIPGFGDVLGRPQDFLASYLGKGGGVGSTPEIAAYVGIPGRDGNDPTYMPIPGTGDKEYVRAYGIFNPQTNTGSILNEDGILNRNGPARSDSGRQIAIPAHALFNRKETLDRMPEVMIDRFGKPIPEGFMPGLPSGQDFLGSPRFPLLEKHRTQAPQALPQSAPVMRSPVNNVSPQSGDPFAHETSEFRNMLNRLGVNDPSSIPAPVKKPDNPYMNESPEFQDMMRRLGVIE
jgi:hypothetical protein